MVPNFPPGTPLSVIIIGIMLSFLAANSSKVAKIPGFIGAIARSVQNRQLGAVQRKTALDSAIDAAVADQVERKTAPFKAEIEAMRRTINNLSERLEQAEEERRRERSAHRAETEYLTDWIARARSWWHRTRIWLANEGIEVREDMPDFEEFNPHS